MPRTLSERLAACFRRRNEDNLGDYQQGSTEHGFSGGVRMEQTARNSQDLNNGQGNNLNDANETYWEDKLYGLVGSCTDPISNAMRPCTDPVSNLINQSVGTVSGVVGPYLPSYKYSAMKIANMAMDIEILFALFVDFADEDGLSLLANANPKKVSMFIHLCAAFLAAGNLASDLLGALPPEEVEEALGKQDAAKKEANLQIARDKSESERSIAQELLIFEADQPEKYKRFRTIVRNRVILCIFGQFALGGLVDYVVPADLLSSLGMPPALTTTLVAMIGTMTTVCGTAYYYMFNQATIEHFMFAIMHSKHSMREKFHKNLAIVPEFLIEMGLGLVNRAISFSYIMFVLETTWGLSEKSPAVATSVAAVFLFNLYITWLTRAAKMMNAVFIDFDKDKGDALSLPWITQAGNQLYSVGLGAARGGSVAWIMLLQNGDSALNQGMAATIGAVLFLHAWLSNWRIAERMSIKTELDKSKAKTSFDSDVQYFNFHQQIVQWKKVNDTVWMHQDPARYALLASLIGRLARFIYGIAGINAMFRIADTFGITDQMPSRYMLIACQLLIGTLAAVLDGFTFSAQNTEVLATQLVRIKGLTEAAAQEREIVRLNGLIEENRITSFDGQIVSTTVNPMNSSSSNQYAVVKSQDESQTQKFDTNSNYTPISALHDANDIESNQTPVAFGLTGGGIIRDAYKTWGHFRDTPVDMIAVQVNDQERYIRQLNRQVTSTQQSARKKRVFGESEVARVSRINMSNAAVLVLQESDNGSRQNSFSMSNSVRPSAPPMPAEDSSITAAAITTGAGSHNGSRDGSKHNMSNSVRPSAPPMPTVNSSITTTGAGSHNGSRNGSKHKLLLAGIIVSGQSTDAYNSSDDENDNSLKLREQIEQIEETKSNHHK